MGRWNRRYFPRGNRRNRYQDPNWSPPRESYPDPEFTVWQDNVPLWEKKFCYQSGVAWEKVLTRRNCNEWCTSVLDWDDLAGKEAFHQAKEIYWAKINNLKCDHHTPDPDLYIDEVDWNPHIDPEVARDLDKAFFLPDEHDTRSRSPITNATTSAWEDIKKTIDDDFKVIKRDPWESAVNKDNFWERGNGQTSGSMKDKTTKWSPWESAVDKDNPWELGNGHTSGSIKDKTTKWDPWGDGGANKAANSDNLWNKTTAWDDGGAKEATRNDSRWNKTTGWDDGGAKEATRNDSRWNKTTGWDDGVAKKMTSNDNPWNKATGWDDAWDGAKKAANNDTPLNKATGWGDAWDRAQRPASSGKPWGKAAACDSWNDHRDGGAKKTPNNWDCPTAMDNSWGNGWSKVDESKPQNLSGSVKVSSHNNSRSWRQCGNKWADSRVSPWGNNNRPSDAANNRSSYRTGPNSQYQQCPGQKGASNEGNSFGGQKRWERHDNSNTARWSQKGQGGETYGGPRKREGSQYWEGPRGSRLRYVDQTSQR